MSVAFDPRRPLIVVPAIVDGPIGHSVLKMAVDTGATTTVVRTAILNSLGYDLRNAPDRVRAATASGIEVIPKMAIAGIDALGRARADFKVLGHALPPSAQIDGLLGLDFLRGRKLIIEFDNGLITLT
jgi:predicted aspartyl protease